MNGPITTTHDEIIGLLPDFATGELSDGDLWRVEAHLMTCAECRADLQTLLSLIGVAPAPVTPSADVKGRLFAAAGLILPSPGTHGTPESLDAVRTRRRSYPAGITWAVRIAAALAIVTGGWWSFQTWQDEDDDDRIAAFISQPEFAHSLTDSEIPNPATATMYVDPAKTEALLTGGGLAPLAGGEHYVVWLFTASGERSNAGTVTPDDDGDLVAFVEAPIAFDAYWAVGISIETDAAVSAPTTPLIIGGWIR